MDRLDRLTGLPNLFLHNQYYGTIEEYLAAVDRLQEGGVDDIELEDRLTELQRKFALLRSECMHRAA